MGKAENGSLGGIATRDKFGIELCPECGQLLPLNFYERNGQKGGLIGGRKGGLTTLKRYGIEFFRQNGKKGGRPRNA